MITCARAGCTEEAAALLVADVSARTAWLTDLADDIAGTELCARHAARFSVPMGWEFHDERTQPAEPPAATDPQPLDEPSPGDSSTSGRWDGPARDDEGTLDAPESPLLARAFGNNDTGRLAVFERVEHQRERDPEGLREGEEDQRHHDGDDDGTEQEAGNTSALRDEHAGEHGDHQDGGEAENGVDPYRADELPFPPFETELAAGTPLSEVDPATEQAARPADRTPEPGGSAEQSPRRGLYEAGHAVQPTAVPSRLGSRQGTA